jgi:predicted ferric reductase
MAIKSDQSIDEIKPVFSFGSFTLIMVIVFLGSMATAILLPHWLPGLTSSITEAKPKAFWYLSRGSAITAYLLLWLSMILGTGITNKLSALWPGLPSTIELHEYTSILGLAFGLFHGLILMGDRYIGFNLAKILLPFSTTSYKPLAIGIGQIAFYIWIILDISFYIRKSIGRKVWRAIHFASFLTYVAVLFHALIAGTDAASNWMQTIYWVTGGLLLFMITFRILASRANAQEKRLRLQNLPPKLPVQ